MVSPKGASSWTLSFALLNGWLRRVLDGVPASVKDLLLWEGTPTLRGSLALSPTDLDKDDSPCVARLKEAGAILVGKTTTPEVQKELTN